MKSISPGAIAKAKEKNTENMAPATTRTNLETELEMSKVGLIAILAVGGVGRTAVIRSISIHCFRPA